MDLKIPLLNFDFVKIHMIHKVLVSFKNHMIIYKYI